MKRLIFILFPLSVFGQCPLPSSISDTANIILWLCPDDKAYDKDSNVAGIGDTVYYWGDKSQNNWVFQNTRNDRRPVLDTSEGNTYLMFQNGSLLENLIVDDSINGLNEFSIYIVVKSNVTNTDNGIMYWKYPPDNQDDGLCIRYDASGWNTGRPNVLKMGLMGNVANNQIETTSNTQTTERQVITITWKDGGKLYSYLDGVPNDSSVNNVSGPLSGIQEILIGRGAKDDNSNEGWSGGIGTIIFYNYQQTPEEVEDIAEELPVELVDFRAEISGDRVVLRWTTATEINSWIFVIQRSYGSVKYRDIDFVMVEGNSNYLVSYEFSDEPEMNGIIYYRLKQMDVDGKYEFSKTIAISVDGEFVFYPNPCNGELYLEYPLISDSLCIRIVDMGGRTVYDNILWPDDFINDRCKIILPELDSGLYIFQVDSNLVKMNDILIFE